MDIESEENSKQWGYSDTRLGRPMSLQWTDLEDVLSVVRVSTTRGSGVKTDIRDFVLREKS